MISVVEYYGAMTKRGIYVHAVPADRVVGEGWYQSLCHHSVFLVSDNEAWDWARRHTSEQCINCRMAISKDPEDAKNRNGG